MKNIRTYRLNSQIEPTDAQLSELMRQVSVEARKSSINAKLVLKEKMNDLSQKIISLRNKR